MFIKVNYTWWKVETSAGEKKKTGYFPIAFSLRLDKNA